MLDGFGKKITVSISFASRLSPSFESQSHLIKLLDSNLFFKKVSKSTSSFEII